MKLNWTTYNSTNCFPNCFFSTNHIHLFYCYGDGLIIVSQVDLTDAPVGLGHDLVGEVHGVRHQDDAEDGHHNVDGDVDVGALLHDGVHYVRALEGVLLGILRDGNIICTQLRTFLKVWIKSATNKWTICWTGLKSTKHIIFNYSLNFTFSSILDLSSLIQLWFVDSNQEISGPGHFNFITDRIDWKGQHWLCWSVVSFQRKEVQKISCNFTTTDSNNTHSLLPWMIKDYIMGNSFIWLNSSQKQRHFS